MEEELRRKGKLPAGLTVDLADHYVDMTGTGELWVNDEGLPIRQVLQMTFPPAPIALPPNLGGEGDGVL
jgi:hypothetical protein